MAQAEHRAIASSIYEQWRCACGWEGSGDFWAHIEAALSEARAESVRLREQLEAVRAIVEHTIWGDYEPETWRSLKRILEAK